MPVAVLSRARPISAKGTSEELMSSKLRTWVRVGSVGAWVAALAVAAAGCGGDDSETATTTTGATRAPATAATVSKLVAVATRSGRPIYWVGSQPNTTYELTQTSDGRVYIRYLPRGAKVGDPKPKYLSVGTYPQRNAFATLKATAKKQGVPTTSLAGGGLAFQDKTHPTSVYVAYPGSDYQIEIFAPSAARAKELVTSGRVVPLGSPPAQSNVKAASETDLKDAAVEVGHPVYWAGTEPKTTYELTKTPSGRIYIRYLPEGVEVGSPKPDYLTVGTYPQKGALAILKATAAKTKAKAFAVAGGGLAFQDTSHPTSVYVAFPGSDLQVEVYDPDAKRARQLVTSGQIAPVR
jgi:hypothetical protein